MHDCRKIKDKLIDLVFNEAGQDEKLRLIAEVDGCDECLEMYRSMTQTLSVFDRAVEAGMPEESYWRGYEMRLHARLTGGPQASIWRQSLDRLRGIAYAALMPLQVKIAVALLILFAGLWLAFFRRADDSTLRPTEIAQPIPLLLPSPQDRPVEPVAPRVVEPPKVVAQRPHKKRAQPVKEVIGSFEPSDRPSRKAASMMLLSAETANHIGKTELLLRAFRNARPLDERSGFDISYEKLMSRELLAKNMLLRRAAHNDNSVAEDLLASVEPILLDIANLPERASQDDVRAVRELIRKQEIISALQFYSAKALSQDLNRKNYDLR